MDMECISDELQEETIQSRVCLTDMPREILEYIVFDVWFGLTYADTQSLQLVSKLFHSIIHCNDRRWRTNFLLRWPHCVKSSEYSRVKCWRDLYGLRVQSEQKMEAILLRVTEVLVHKSLTPKCITQLIGSDEKIFHTDFVADCIVDELYQICSSRQEPLMSRQYYSVELLGVVRVKALRSSWEARIKECGGVDNVPFHEALQFVGCSLSPGQDFRSLDVDGFLHEMSLKVLESVKCVKKSLYDRAVEQGLMNKEHGKPMWDYKDNGELMECIILWVLNNFSTYGLEVDHSHYLEEFIQQHLLANTAALYPSSSPKASPSLCALLTVCLAERVGVVCEVKRCRPIVRALVLSFQSYNIDEDSLQHFDFTHPKTSSGELLLFTSQSKHYSEVLRVSPSAATIMQILTQYVELDADYKRSLKLSSKELLAYLYPENISLLHQLMICYDDNDVNIAEIKELNQILGHHMQHLPRLNFNHLDVDELKPPDDPVRSRDDPDNAAVKYSVGMVMYHTLWNYDCVIVSWTPLCEAPNHWIEQMGVDRLPLGPNQPFYNVLVSDQSQRYAAQENLACHRSPILINHKEVGRLMSSFEGTHFVMNEALQKYYPHDLQLTQENAKQRYT